ncbi:MAG: putative toxin-antitoxin system toxin component, PIN family [Chloroflexota bacterium]|nr:MAG: putative toxin-antitoxin system toxin component, PIN family [Chloroflexota bacterium]
MRAVVDTQELVRMVTTRGGSGLYQAWRAGDFLLVMSEMQFAELSEVLSRPQLARYVRAGDAEALYVALREASYWVSPSDGPGLCRDPNDEYLLAQAIAGQADFLVSSDKDLYDDAILVRVMKEQYRVRVVMPEKFLAILANQSRRIY